MVKCVAFGCKSGYRSCSENVHIFSVPKDKNIIKKWQIAIFRDDIKLKPSDHLCKKHFHPEDIIREKLTYANDGVTVLGRSSLSRPKLKTGAIPAFGRPEKTGKKPRKPMERVKTESIDISHDDSVLIENEETEENPGIDADLPESPENQFEIIKFQLKYQFEMIFITFRIIFNCYFKRVKA